MNNNNSGPIQTLIKQLEVYDTELKRLNKEIKEIRAKRIEHEKRLLEFLKTNDQPGLKFQGRAYIYDQSTMTKPKKKVDRERDLKQTLEKFGVRANDAMVDEVMKSLKGSTYVKDKITTKTYM